MPEASVAHSLINAGSSMLCWFSTTQITFPATRHDTLTADLRVLTGLTKNKADKEVTFKRSIDALNSKHCSDAAFVTMLVFYSCVNIKKAETRKTNKNLPKLKLCALQLSK